MLNISNHYTYYGSLHWFHVFVDCSIFPTITLTMAVFIGLMCLLMPNISNHYTYYGRLHQFDVFVDAQYFQPLHLLW